MTPVDHVPYTPFVVIDSDNQRVVARFAAGEQAVSYAVLVGAYVVDSTPKLLPSTPGWYEAAKFPLTESGYSPYLLDAEGVWHTASGSELTPAVMVDLGPLTLLRAAT